MDISIKEIFKPLVEEIFNEKKEITAGVLMHSQQKIFLVLPYGSSGWGFPKGHVEDGESIFLGGRREFIEETGIQIPNDPKAYLDLGKFKLPSGKILYMFAIEGTGREKFIGSNLIDHGLRKGLPENNTGAYWEIEKAYKVLHKGQDAIVKEFLKLTS